MTVRLAWLCAIAGFVAPGHAADSAASTATSITPLSITAIGKNTFMLRDPLTLSFSDGAPAITVPAGFVTDLSGIPKDRRWWDGKAEPSMAAVVLLDYLYWYQPCTQEEAAAVVYRALPALGTSKPTAAAAFQAINRAGPAAFKKNGELRRGGEVRTFTVAYAQTLVHAPHFNPGETLDSALRKAQSAAGLVKQESASPAVKLTCARLLYQCEPCRDQAARKKTPNARVADPGRVFSPQKVPLREASTRQ